MLCINIPLTSWMRWQKANWGHLKHQIYVGNPLFPPAFHCYYKTLQRMGRFFEGTMSELCSQSLSLSKLQTSYWCTASHNTKFPCQMFWNNFPLIIIFAINNKCKHDSCGSYMALNRSVSKLIVNGAREYPTRPSSSNILVVVFMWAVTKSH